MAVKGLIIKQLKVKLYLSVGFLRIRTIHFSLNIWLEGGGREKKEEEEMEKANLKYIFSHTTFKERKKKIQHVKTLQIKGRKLL